jgi:glycosyltransferase involved in cell wall biosynthesis
LRFLLICWGDPFTTQAGTEIYIGNLAIELAVHGHDVHLLYGGKIRKGDLYPPTKHLATHPFHPINIPYIRALDFRRKCANLGIELINEFRIDVVMASGAGTFPGYIFDKIKKLKSTPLLVYYAMDSMVMEYKRIKTSKEPEGLLADFKKWVWYTALIRSDKTSCLNSDLILASSKDTVNHLIANYSISSNKIIVLYEGVPDDFADGVGVVDPDLPTFLHIGGGSRKGTGFFLKALKLLEEKYNLKAKAIITRADSNLNKKVRELGIDAEVHKYVSSLELKRFYASCTALVSPSLSEGFCLPVVEAAMFGKSAIVARTGSLPELVNDGIDGYVIPVADVDSLAERMYELATNDELRRRISIKAKEKAEKFKISVVAKNFISIISRNNSP